MRKITSLHVGSSPLLCICSLTGQIARNDVYFYAATKDTSLLQLAIGMVRDLGLNNRCRAAKPTFGSIVEDAAELRNDLPPQPKQTSDGRRAVLGVYYMASS